MNLRGRIILLSGLFVLGIIYYITRLKMTGIPYYANEDAIYHLNRLVGLENVWISPVNYNSFVGMGSLANIFYPWLTMYPMWILFKLCGSFVWAYKLYYVLLGILTLYLSFFLLQRITGNDLSAFCFAVLYTFSSYRFADVFYRGALGECIALAFLPLVCLGMHEIFWKRFERWYILSIAMALLAYSHLLTLLLTSILVLTVAIIFLVKTDCRKQRFCAFLKAAFLAILLSLGALVPIAQAGLSVLMHHPDGSVEQLVSEADSIFVILGNSVTNAPTAHGVGLLVLIVLVLDVVLLVRAKDKKQLGIPIFFMILGTLLFICTSSLVPWGILAKLPFIRVIQFPWRLNAFVTLFLFLAFAMMLPDVLEKLSKWKALIPIGIVLCAVGLNLWSVIRLKPSELFRIKEEYVRSMSYAHMDYTPEAYYQAFCEGIGPYRMDGERITPDVTVSSNGDILQVDLEDGKRGQILEVPVCCSLMTKAKVNDVKTDSWISERGTVLLRINTDGPATVEVYNRYTALIYASWSVSLLAFVFLAILAAREYSVK